MLKRVLIDNFRCFSNFEFRPNSRGLIVGSNGTGKTSFLEALSVIRDLVAAGGLIDDFLPPGSRTAWRSDPRQTFEIDVALRSGNFRYTLILDRGGPIPRTKVLLERVDLDGSTLFLFDDGTIHLLNDSGEEQVQFPFDPNRSGLATVQPRHSNDRLMEFKSWLTSSLFLRPNPQQFQASLAVAESALPGQDFQWLLNWYRFMVQERPNDNADFTASLMNVIPDLVAVRLESVGPGARILTFEFRQMGGPIYKIGFHQLSDGQRMLFIVYAVLHFVLVTSSLLVIDEPDNYLALREIQPWLMEVERRMPDDGQLLLISHHPELLANFSADETFHFRRVTDGVIRAELVPANDPAGLSLQERIARGWLNG